MRILEHERSLDMRGIGDDAPTVGIGKLCDHPQQRRLSASGWSQHGEKLASVDAQVHPFDHDELVVEDAPDALQSQGDPACGFRSRRTDHLMLDPTGFQHGHPDRSLRSQLGSAVPSIPPVLSRTPT